MSFPRFLRSFQSLLVFNLCMSVTGIDPPNSPPSFQESQYIGTYYEEQPIGTKVLKVEATDKEGHPITYELGSDAQGKFKINSVTGQITANEVLDRERIGTVDFTAYANDNVTRNFKVNVPVRIYILDINDNRPVFIKTPYATTVKENVGVSTPVFVVSTTDADQSQNALVTYSIDGGNQGNKFAISQYTGQVIVVESLDYESVKSYTLQISAKDRGKNGSLNTSAVLSIQVEDADDLPAVFNPKSYAATVTENSPPGTFVVAVTARDGDLVLNAPVQYLIDQETNVGGAFTINNNTGVITVNGALDREAKASYLVRVGAKSTTHKAVYATVSISIGDVNDNSPQFVNAPYAGIVSENSPTGLTVLRVTAEDADLGENATFAYGLIGAESKFTVASTGYILVSGAIDREAKDRYHFEVVAQETQTSQRFKTSTFVTINVTDVNDNNPTCGKSVYKVTIAENNANGTFVTKIASTDSDEGQNAETMYSLTPDNKSDYKSFTIDRHTGVINTTAVFDRESKGKYTITIRATDQPLSGQARFGECTVEVTIGDQNDNKPSFTSLPNVTTISEAAASDTNVFTVAATDADEGVNAAVTYSIVSGNVGNMFTMDVNSGVLKTSKSLDRETVPSYTLGIQAIDGGLKTSVSQLTVRVLDVNDNPPVFSHPGGYTFAVDEGGVGNRVGMVVASDRDEGTNSVITYELKRVDDYAKFTVNNKTGEIKAAVALDRETEDTHTIRIIARDGGSKIFESEVTVHINVTDVNDHRPVFGQRYYQVAVVEQQPAQTVLNLAASDADIGINSAFRFSILSGNTGNSFVIDPNTGTLSTAKPLDREVRSHYILMVRVADLHGNSDYGIVFHDSAIVEVFVQDINDHMPLFSKALYSVTVPENITLGTQVVHLSAGDKDSGDNRMIEYSIVRGNGLGRFMVDPSSGRLTVRTPIDRDPPNNETSFLLTVMAEDKGNSSLNSTVMVSITVVDVNDSPPEFSSSTYSVTIQENIAPGSTILSPTFHDRDLGKNGEVSFRINEGNDEVPPKFRIDAASGTLTVVSGFDYDKDKKSFVLTIAAVDKGDSPLTGTATVTVNVANINDNTPVFSQDRYSFSVKEGSYQDNSKVIGKIVATDSDADVAGSPYGVITYSFINQSSYYRTYHWLLNEAINGDLPGTTGSVSARLFGGATIRTDPDFGNVVYLNGKDSWIRVGDFENNCTSNPSLCLEGLTVAFWLNFLGGRYIISSGGKSGFAAGFAFHQQSNKFVLTMATLIKKWEIKIDSIPKDWFYATFTWDSQAGLAYFQDGRLVSSDPSSDVIARVSDAFTLLSVGRPNSIESADYYGNMSVSDLILWKTRLTSEEVLHSYQISRHKTGKPMPTAPQFIGLFSINHNTGEISAIGQLNRETKANFTLDVRATDSDPVSPRHNSSVVFVEVLDTNDNAPEFSQASYLADLVEHSPIGHSVIKLTAVDRDIGVNSNISYSIASGSGGAFTIDSRTGLVTTATDIDREKTRQYVLGVRAADAGNPSLQSTVQVTINIADINDNSPVLTPSTYTASIRENLPAGQSILHLVVNDPDDGQNGEVTFEVNSAKFFVNRTSGILYNSQPLDREIQSQYQLTIQATDKGTLPKSTSVEVRVNILDENDNFPRFSQAVYRVATSENMTTGSRVVRVTASDPDQGSNGDIAFSLESGEGHFAINKTSGVISVTKLLDREAKPNGYSLTVVARDHGYPTSRYSTARVNVTISDINDNAPKFDKFTYSGMIREDAFLSDVVTNVKASDKDEGLSGAIIYSITGGNNGGVFAINNSGVIIVAKRLDRESKAAYELTVTATDRAADPKSASVEVDITVTDANDNPPGFSKIPPVILISESALPGTPVFTAIATDPDIGNNGEIMYAGRSDEGKFHVNQNTGVISTVGSLDYEKVKSYTFYVVAMDRGRPQLNSTTLKVNISVVDANDNNPTFKRPSYSASVSENAALGTLVLQVNATEKDSGLLSKIGYNISAGDALGFFDIEYYSGRISVKKFLDREKVPSYTLLVTATDNGTPPRYGQTSVTIIVMDVNDRPPVFKFTDYQKEIPEDAAVGSTVLTVDAVDEDIPENTKLQYTIVTGNDDGYFEMATVKTGSDYLGVINVAKLLDRETKGLFKFNISVSDGNYSGSATVDILLSDVNDQDPEFNASATYTAHVLENSAGGLLVLHVSATDQDLGENSKITYSMTGADDKFTIDANTGEIRTSPQPLDREGKSAYFIRVVARDAGGREGTVQVIIYVTDENDNAPVFKPASYSVTLREGAATQAITIVDVNATDQDEGSNKQLVFSIISGNLRNVFFINNETGVISTRINLDREAPGLHIDQQGRGVYTLMVKAADHGDPKQTATAEVKVIIVDINDNPPVFPPDGYTVIISEGAKANQDVVAAKATDKDAGDNQKITYELLSGNTEGDFRLDPTTAMIKTAKNLSRQLKFSYVLDIGATDHGKPSLSATTHVRIVVGDINDNAPVFSPVNYTVTVYENAPIGAFLVNVTATDSDNGQNAKISYSITSGDPFNVFKVQTEDTHGRLEVGGLVDREVKSSYELLVTATDGGVPLSRKAEAKVFVTVLDRNDNPPVFTHVQYSGTIVENSVPAQVVPLVNPVQTSDRDIGINSVIRYHLNGTDASQFVVDPNSGVISTRSIPPPTLDHETVTNYTFYVVAVDQKGSGRSSFARVVIKITDANDNTPKFLPLTKSVTVSEAASLGFSVAKVTATDPDSNLNGRVSYSIIKGAEGKFDIDRNNGDIRVSGALDRETTAVYRLNVSALDGSYYPREGFGAVFVTLVDVNDNAPKLSSQVYRVEISEASPLGSFLVNVSATDPDSGGNAQIAYSMNDPNFAISPTTGTVTTTALLDRETRGTYSFTVSARDGGGLTSNATVNVIILDENDNSPYFPQNDFYKTDINEKTPVGAIILTIVADDKDSGPNGQITYSINESKADLFSIDPSSGLVRVHQVIDRIALRRDGLINVNGSFAFKVVASDNGSPRRQSSINVTVNIVQTGDDSPVFNRSSYLVAIRENQPPGTSVLQPIVVKSRPGATLIYSFVSSQTLFAIDARTGLITTLQALDREKQDNYVFTVQVTESEQTSFSGYTSVVVKLTDENDHAPQFQFPAPYKMTVIEDAPVGTGLGQVRAVDADLGENAKFEYSITHANIGPGQRVISLKTDCTTPLGLERGDIKSSDMTATSELKISDEDYSPTQGRLNALPFTNAGVDHKGAWCASVSNKNQYIQIDLQGMRKVTRIATQGRPGSSDYVKSYRLSFSKDEVAFTPHRTVFDGNSDSNSIQTNYILPTFHSRYVRVHPESWKNRICMRIEFYGCKSTGQDQVALPFIIDPYSGFINTSLRLDRELQEVYVLTVEVKDSGSPSLNSTTTVEITVADTNDNAPTFTQSLYYASVPENAYGGYQVIRVRAADPDAGSNAFIKYAITDGGNGKFIIETTSGIVRPSGHLDYELMLQKYYVLNISASDSGHPVYSSTAQLNVSVTDYNDNKPVFSESVYTVGVPEDSQRGSVVLQVVASDADSGENAKVTYTIEGGAGSFAIETNTGNISLLNDLNREKTDRYQATITATDNGVPVKLSSKAEVNILVLDVNDNSPVFRSPRYARKMSEGVSVGTIVLVVQADDADIGSNGDIRYDITTGNDAGMFMIDNVTGSVIVAKRLDREKESVITMTVTAKDQGKTSRSDTASVEVTLTDMNDNAPVIKPKKMTASVNENVETATFVTKVMASDNDTEQNGVLEYAIMHGDMGKFVINSSSGHISTSGALNREERGLYTLIIMVRDQGLVPYMDFGTVDVTVLDMNDNKPTFLRSFGPFTVPENQPNGTRVGDVVAEDKDIEVNADITYSITAGDPSKSLSIDPKTGVIYTTQPLDREKFAKYDLVISAANLAASPQLATSAKVTVNVLDTNDFEPVFIKGSYNRSISELSPPGTSVVTVSATDRDEGTNGRVLYRIRYDLSSADSDVFAVHAETGLITLQVRTNDHEYRRFTLMVEGKDIGSPVALASLVPVYVNIVDVNDNQPVFQNALYSAVTSEATPSGTSLARVEASDKDHAENAHITYKFISGNEKGHFSMNKTSGEVYVNKPLDRETQPAFSMVVGAFNYETKAYNSQTTIDANGYFYDTTTVQVNLTDVNDNPPQFVRPVFTGGIPEGAELNTYILTTTTRDPDLGNYSAVQYRIISGNEGGFFRIEENTGNIVSASLFKGKKGQRYTIKVTASDNYGRTPSLEAAEPATVRIFVLLEDQRITLVAEVDPTLIETNRAEFTSVLSNITEGEVYIEQIYKVLSTDKNGDNFISSEVVFHVVNHKTQTLMTNNEVLSEINNKKLLLELLYAKWKLQYVTPSPTSVTGGSGMTNAELALIILGTVIGLLLLFGLCFAVRTRCIYKKRDMYSNTQARGKTVSRSDSSREKVKNWSYYNDDAFSGDDTNVAPVRMHSSRQGSFSSDIRPATDRTRSNEYLLSKKKLSQGRDDKIWTDGNFYMSQESKFDRDSYLDDDGESATRSDVSHAGSSRIGAKSIAMKSEDLPVTNV